MSQNTSPGSNRCYKTCTFAAEAAPIARGTAPPPANPSHTYLRVRASGGGGPESPKCLSAALLEFEVGPEIQAGTRRPLRFAIDHLLMVLLRS